MGPKKVLDKKEFGQKKLSKKNLVPKHFIISTACGLKEQSFKHFNIFTTFLDYRSPTNQVLASYYAQNPPKSFWQVVVVGGGYYTKFSVLLWAKALVLAQAQAEQKDCQKFKVIGFEKMPILVLAQSRTLNLVWYPPPTTRNFLEGSRHSRRLRFGMQASYSPRNQFPQF